ncbi:Mur ligase domain-containing protein [Candidatus Pelagibacter sp. Uisw_090]|uniref:Mur ligase domain-containing protein n=1 Tax=Candidatus Pelagibacter sp. Uisw_090 TaxID=3230993 RepID=UPI0039E96DA7
MIIGNFIKGIELKHRNHYFSGICFNSLKCKKNNIFFAIKGIKIDGNKFINQAIQKGAKTIISNQKFEGIKKNILFIRSSNVRKSLSEFAYTIYKVKPNNIIAVTGTNGKSSVADFYFQILRLNKKKVAYNWNPRC